MLLRVESFFEPFNRSWFAGGLVTVATAREEAAKHVERAIATGTAQQFEMEMA